eukprot:2973024-Alexandrium_andersonii.AAC.1
MVLKTHSRRPSSDRSVIRGTASASASSPPVRPPATASTALAGISLNVVEPVSNAGSVLRLGSRRQSSEADRRRGSS